MKVYTVIQEEYLNEPKIAGVYSTLAQAYSKVQACFKPYEKIENETVTNIYIKISTNRFDYWIYINTLDE